MILDDNCGQYDDDGLVDDADAGDGEGEVGEWLDGLRAAGLPVTTVRHADSRRGVSEPAAALIAASWAPATLRSYESSWGIFAGWLCARGVHDPLEATEVDVADYIAYHVQAGLSAAYLARNLTAIAHGFEIANRPSPTKHPLAARTAAGARRTIGAAQRRAAPLRLDDLRRLIAGMAIVTGRKPSDAMIRRDRALLTVGWAAALRAGELVALNVDDVTFTGDPDRGAGGMLIHLHRSKTDQTAAGAHVAVPYSTHIGSCPVRSLQLLARDRRSGPLFRTIDRHRRIGGRLSADAVSLIVRRHVERVLGHDPGLYSGHSLRAGFVTEARHQGIAPHLIMRQTRHSDARMLTVYDRPADLLTEPVLAGEWW
jgi:integrase